MVLFGLTIEYTLVTYFSILVFDLTYDCTIDLLDSSLVCKSDHSRKFPAKQIVPTALLRKILASIFCFLTQFD